jgi:hypothetical protein
MMDAVGSKVPVGRTVCVGDIVGVTVGWLSSGKGEAVTLTVEMSCVGINVEMGRMDCDTSTVGRLVLDCIELDGEVGSIVLNVSDGCWVGVGCSIGGHGTLFCWIDCVGEVVSGAGVRRKRCRVGVAGEITEEGCRKCGFLCRPCPRFPFWLGLLTGAFAAAAHNFTTIQKNIAAITNTTITSLLDHLLE